MLTVSDLRWMEEQRRRAALRRMLQAEQGALAELGASGSELQQMLDLPARADICAAARRPPTLAHRLGCPG